MSLYILISEDDERIAYHQRVYIFRDHAFLAASKIPNTTVQELKFGRCWRPDEVKVWAWDNEGSEA